MLHVEYKSVTSFLQYVLSIIAGYLYTSSQSTDRLSSGQAEPPGHLLTPALHKPLNKITLSSLTNQDRASSFLTASSVCGKKL